MSEMGELLPVDWDLDLPRPVIEALLDMGRAANSAAGLVHSGLTQQQTAIVASRAAVPARPHAGLARWVADESFAAAISYTEQVTGVYGVVAARYASYAARTAVAVGFGEPPPGPDAVGLAPSQVLTQPASLLPLAQLAAAVAGSVTDHNARLAASHRDLLTQIRHTAPLTLYDDPARLAGRAAGSVDVSVELPDALHRYAAVCVVAIGLVTARAPIAVST